MAGWVEGGFGSEDYRDFRCIVTRTNGLPAVACYRRAPGAAAYTPLALDVLKLHGEQAVEITTFEWTTTESTSSSTGKLVGSSLILRGAAASRRLRLETRWR